ncbi:MAG: hypothetical protein GXO47_12730 [Chlorobi bacterium]|nr:hypothetical protein [Chlorobiota bacterium]
MINLNRVLFLITIGLTILASNVNAQKYTYSPYSRYGVGDLEQRGYGRGAAMGGTGIALRSNKHLNDLNPASLTAMDSTSFFFEGGIKGFYQGLETTDNSAGFSDINFEYFAIGFPVAKWAAATLGIRPQSGTGYNFENITTDDVLGDISQQAYGSGSLTRAYTGIGFQPFKFLSAGFHLSYIFGNLISINTVDYLQHQTALAYGRKQNIHVNDVFLDFGLQAVVPLKDKSELILGVTYNPKTPLNGYTEELVARGTAIEQENELFIDSDTLYYNKKDFSASAFDLPLSLGFGLTYVYDNRLTLTADFSTSAWDDITFPDEFTRTTDRSRFAFGAEFIPNDRNPKTYLSRIRYRVGTHYLKDYLVINDYQLKDFGISFGLGFPLKRSKTSLNLAFEYGSRGTTDYNLVKENYFNVKLNITLYEVWFMKRKFD